jgi:hypothetical protein
MPTPTDSQRRVPCSSVNDRLSGTVDYFVDAVFNYPTLAEAYTVAALDVTNKLRVMSELRV